MKKKFKIFIIILLFSAIFVPKALLSISIKVTGSWSETIDNTNLQGGAGTDLISTYQSTLCDLDIAGSAKNNWRVDVRKVDTQWHINLHLYIRRTSDGSGTGSISGGSVYQEITDLDQAFLSGYGNRRNISLQYQLDGVSVQVSPNTYSTTVYYTVVKN